MRNKEKSVRSNSVNDKAREEGGRGGAPGTEADTPLQPMEETTVEQFPASCGRDGNETDISLQSMERNT